MTQKEFAQIYPQPEWVGHDPMEIWPSQLDVMVEAIGRIDAHISEVAAIGITDQRKTTIIWDEQTGVPIYNAIMQQCRGASDIIEKSKVDDMEQLMKGRTGLTLDAYFSGSKIAWVLNHVEGARERVKRGELLFGTVDI